MPNGTDDAVDEGFLVEEGVTHHGGAPPRGLMSVPKSRLHEGRFGRMFRNLPIPRPPREALVNDVLTNGRKFFEWEDQPFMPVEFSVAAYRFGHSMIRPAYDLNEVVTGVPIFSRKDRPANREHLGGFRRLPSFWTIDWSHFVKIDRTRPQRSRKINIRLARPLMKLPASVNAGRNPLAVLNLRRGKALQLPSGQSVAQHMGETPLTAAELELSRLRGLKAAHRALLEQDTPLWFYVLKEAEVRANDERLGPVGGRIVAEVLIGLLDGDPSSFLRVEPNWKPAGIPAKTAGEFTLADLLTFATR